MKTTEEWMNFLPKEFRDRALLRMKEHCDRYGMSKEETIKRNHSSFPRALNCFIWADTPEGDPFWRRIYGKFCGK